VIEWQLRALAAAGIDRVVVVVGFAADAVERHLADVCLPGMRVRTLYNELYDRTDNLVSCAAAHAEMREDFLLLNGDTLLEPMILSRLLTSRKTPVAMAVARKDGYDADDMKVACDGPRVTRVGKDLRPDEIDGEAIGVSLYRGEGPELFCDAVTTMLRQRDGARRWYLSAVNLLAARGLVRAVAIGDAGWGEIDYIHDLPRAEALVAGWEREAATAEPALVASGQ
jgi:choline kinase